jgi:hypothetical protein
MTINDKKIARLARTVGLVCAITAPLSLAGESAIDEAAVERLKASLGYVGTLNTFALETDTTIEVVLEDGQKLQFDNATRATVKRPDRFHAKRLGDLVDQEFFYNGNTLVLQDSTAGFHASVAAPDTVEGMLDFARDSLDIVAPAGDFIYSNAFELLMDGVESAMHLGPSYIEGTVCDHLAFSAPGNGTDFQIWVQQGEKPLPRRIVITSRDILNAPQFTTHIREWDVAPDIPKGLFDFDAQDSSTEIEFILMNVGENQ